MRRTTATLAYWVPTVIVVANWTFGGISALVGTASSLQVFTTLGYPPYFAGILGTAQLLGVIAILAPVPRTLREWAYAGLTFDVTAAIASIVATGMPLWHTSIPAAALVMVLASYAGWKRSEGSRRGRALASGVVSAS